LALVRRRLRLSVHAGGVGDDRAPNMMKITPTIHVTATPWIRKN